MLLVRKRRRTFCYAKTHKLPVTKKGMATKMIKNAENAAKMAADALIRAKKTLATAESCTGGLLGKLMTDIPGVSEVYLGGGVTYANSAKVTICGVKEETLAAHGAVSPEVAREMAEGIRRALGADVGVSTTGVAGPGGGSADKPVGLVYVGYSDKNGTTAYKLLHGENLSRDEIRYKTAEFVFEKLKVNITI